MPVSPKQRRQLISLAGNLLGFNQPRDDAARRAVQLGGRVRSRRGIGEDADDHRVGIDLRYLGIQIGKSASFVPATYG